MRLYLLTLLGKIKCNLGFHVYHKRISKGINIKAGVIFTECKHCGLFKTAELYGTDVLDQLEKCRVKSDNTKDCS